MSFLRTLTVLACALTGLLAGLKPASALDIASHRAIYTVSLAKARGNIAIETISGQIAYGVKKVCGGWIQAQSGITYLHLNTGEVRAQTLHFSSWESDDGARYRFSVKSEGLNDETLLGSAEIHTDKGARAVFSLPKASTFKLPAKTLFPMAQTALMIPAAQAGKRHVRSFVFEGTEFDGAKLLVVFISPLSPRAKSVMARLGGALSKRHGWNFRLAYFDPAAQNGKPLYEVEADMLDNGVAPRWLLDYGDYVVEMTLRKFEALPKPVCR